MKLKKRCLESEEKKTCKKVFDEDILSPYLFVFIGC